MSSLSQAELYKYPKNTPRDRVKIFIDKLIKSDPFVLNSGKKVVLVPNATLVDALSKRQNLRHFALIDVNGKIHKFSDLKKTAEFGGAGGSTAGTGAGADVTELTESAQALYAAAKWKRTKDYDDTVLKSAASTTDVSENINNILKKFI